MKYNLFPKHKKYIKIITNIVVTKYCNIIITNIFKL